MSRYIKVADKRAAPCCEHCTADDYHSIHHIIPFQMVKDWENPHKYIIKVCRKCHIKMQFAKPTFMFQSNIMKKPCFVCGNKHGQFNYLTKKSTYNDYTFLLNGETIQLCKRCAQHWFNITHTYKQYLTGKY